MSLHPDIAAVLSGESEGCIVCGDCLDIMADMPDGCVGCVVTDPPYGIGFAGQPTKWQRRAGHDPKAWDDDAIEAVPVLIRAGRVQVVWGGNYYRLPTSRGWLAWTKPDSPPSMGSVELAWTNLDKTASHIRHSISATNAERVAHPTQKPLAVMLFTLEYAGDAAIILDPFCGSGTTCVAAKKLGRRWIGIEIDEGYCEIARRRVASTPRPLFTEPVEKPKPATLFEAPE